LADGGGGIAAPVAGPTFITAAAAAEFTVCVSVGVDVPTTATF
jgi:hypothetical protein